jgi:hypothetical protein
VFSTAGQSENSSFWPLQVKLLIKVDFESCLFNASPLFSLFNPGFLFVTFAFDDGEQQIWVELLGTAGRG